MAKNPVEVMWEDLSMTPKKKDVLVGIASRDLGCAHRDILVSMQEFLLRYVWTKHICT